jgi:hypothetical protein
MAFVAYFIFTIIKTKIAKYILTPIIGVLYGFMLFYFGMGVSGILYYVLAVLPVIAVIFRIILLKKAK